MTFSKHTTLLASLIFALFFAVPTTASAQRNLARTVSPSMVMRIIGFQDIRPDDLHAFQRLYESTGWKILKMDDDPSDGEISVYGGRNMVLEMDEFAVSGTKKPNNGIYIHAVESSGFKVDKITIVFNDEQEKALFANNLSRFGIYGKTDDSYEGSIKAKNGDSIDVECQFGYSSMNPMVDISVYR